MHDPDPRDLAALYRIAALAAGAVEAASASRNILGEIMALFAADSGSISLLNPHSGYLEIVTQQGLPPDTGEFALKLGQGLTGWVTLHGKPQLVRPCPSLSANSPVSGGRPCCVTISR